MKKQTGRRQRNADRDTLRPEYDFGYSTGVRGKYYRRILTEGSNVVLLDPDLAKVFRSSSAVNDALRSLVRISETIRQLTAHSRRTTTRARR